MRFFADLHIHSRFSRATSRSLTLSELHRWAQLKGLFLVGTGDVTHPEWLGEIADQLVPAEDGLFRLRDDLARDADARVPPACRGPVRFVLQGEISSIYKHDGAVRKVHSVVYCPGLDGARRLLAALDRLGNVRSDGRPILGLPARDVLEVLLEADPAGRLIPAHVWTPWFSLLGSRSGYDSVEACFGDLAGEIFALETGLSSDPAMNWRVSALDRYALVSNSDAHSPRNLGREANRFDCEPAYGAVFGAMRPGDPRFLGTVEFFPEEGKYHLDGHRKCGCRLEPGESREADGRCPVCGGPLTLGVLHRVEALADRPEGVRPPGAREFQRLVPLAEVAADALGVGSGSKRVAAACDRLLAELGPELHVLRDAPLADVAAVAGPVVAEGVRRVRAGELQVEPGYDGAFGTVRLFSAEERRDLDRQGSLFAVPTGPTPGPRRPGPREPAPRPASPEAAAPEPPVPDGGLNPEQRAAVEAGSGPLVIVAGPGTGKTRTLVHRVARRVTSGGVPAERVAVVTFTNRAADELRERLEALLGPGPGGRVAVSTLHRLGLGLLRAEAPAAGLPPGFPVLADDECAELLGGGPSARRLLEAFAAARRGARLDEDGRAALARFEAALADRGAVWVDDLIARPVALLEADPAVLDRWRQRFSFLAVDEFQDLDPLQYRLVDLLAGSGGDVTVIGDPDQSIYGFRGADPGLFDRFLADRPEARTVRLVRNYRSTATILGAAADLLSRAGGDGVVAQLPGGPRVELVALADERSEARFVAAEVERLVGGTSHRSVDAGSDVPGVGFGDVAVLCRTRAQLAPLEEAFHRAGLPLRVVGGEPAALRGPGRRVLARLRRAPPGDGPAAAVARAVAAEVVDPDLPAARAWTALAAAAPDLPALLDEVVLRTPDDDYDPRADRVAAMTLHAAKGLEFPVVFVLGCEEGLLPLVRPGRDGPDDLDEERRLLYVAMTRARNRLVLTRAERRRLYGRTVRPGPSRFLAGIERARLEVRRVAGPGSRKRDAQLDLFGG